MDLMSSCMFFSIKIYNFRQNFKPDFLKFYIVQLHYPELDIHEFDSRVCGAYYMWRKGFLFTQTLTRLTGKFNM